jgi:hypothetical protein
MVIHADEVLLINEPTEIVGCIEENVDYLGRRKTL